MSYWKWLFIYLLFIFKPAEVELARGGEGGAGDLLGVEVVRAEEGAVLGRRESSGKGLRREAVAVP